MAVIAVGAALVISYWHYRERIRLVEKREIELEQGSAISDRAHSKSASRALAQRRLDQNLVVDNRGNLYGTTSGPGAEAPSGNRGSASEPMMQVAKSGQSCDAAPKDEPASATSFPARAQRTEDPNKWYEQQRQKLCAELPADEHCEPAARIFGLPPEGSIKYAEQFQICSDKTGSCSPTAFPLRKADVPAGCYLKRTQSLIILTKSHGSQSFTGDMIYAWESGKFDEDDPDQGRDWYSLPDFDRINRYFWVTDDGYEDSGTSLGSYDTGKVALSVQDATLLMSPDGAHLMAYWYLVDTEPGNDDIAIYALTRGTLSQVAGLNVSCADPDFVWVTSSEIAMFGCSVTDNGEVTRIRRKGPTWVLDPSNR